MSVRLCWAAWAAMLALVSGCGSSDGGSSAGGGASATGGGGGDTGGSGGSTGGSGGATGGDGGATSGGSGGSSFDPERPGISMSFTVGAALLMGQPTTFAAGAFMATAREDLEPPPSKPLVPLETCEVSETTYTPSCKGPQDCAPEQQCVPETDMNGAAIPNSEHCATPRSPIDVGPFTVSGFASGPKTMAYNAQQNGAYTTPGGDGTVPHADVAFDTTYTFEGEGDSAQGLGPFSGSVRLAPELVLTSPPQVQTQMGVPAIEASVTQDLTLVWSGSDPGAEVTITLAGGSFNGESHSVVCRTADAGGFTIPAAMVQAAQLGDMAFLNMLTIERPTSGSVTGDGITHHDIGTIQTAVINVAKKP